MSTRIILVIVLVTRLVYGVTKARSSTHKLTHLFIKGEQLIQGKLNYMNTKCKEHPV